MADTSEALVQKRKPLLTEAFTATFAVLRTHPATLACIFFTTEFFAQYFLYMGEALHASLPMDSSLMILNEMGLLLTGAMAEGFLIILVPAILYGIERGGDFNSLQHIFNSFNQIFIESIRSLASVIRWGILLLIPGIYKHLCYIFVPLVVLLDPEYETGKVDALKRSSQLSSGRLVAIFIFILVFTGIDYMAFSAHSQTVIFRQPLDWALMAFPKFFLDIFMYSILYVIFRNALQMAQESK